MATFKASKNRNTSSNVFQATSQKSYDPQIVYEWERENTEARNLLNEYIERANSGGYLSADDIEGYRNALDKYIETGSSLRKITGASTVGEWNKSVTSLRAGYDGLSKYYSQWGTEDAYTSALESQKKREELFTYDLVACQEEIKSLEDKLSKADSIKGQIAAFESEVNEIFKNKDPLTANKISNQLYNQNRHLYEELESYGDLDELTKSLSQKKAYYSRAEYAQSIANLYNDALNAEDFDYYSQKGANIENPSYDDATIDKYNLWERLFKDDINNAVTFGRDNKDSLEERIGSSGNSADVGAANQYYRYNHLKDNEVAVYNYYLGKGDIDSAEKYLESLEETLNQREAETIVDNIQGNKFYEMVFAIGAGLDQFASGIGNIDNYIKGTEADPITSTQYASSDIRDSLSGFWGGTYDLISTTSNMLPSILVGSVTGGVGGTLTLGASAVGNAYAEMKNLGYDEGQSRGYATLVGASEAVLQYLLGGIGALGGKLTGNVIGKFVSSLDNAFAKLAIKVGGNMVSEGLEEAIQTAVEPVFKAYATGENFDGAELEDILYSALLGALSAGIIEGIPTTIGTVASNVKAKKQFGDGSKLVSEALENSAEGSDLRTLAEKYQGKLDGGKSLSGTQIIKLNEAIATNDESLIKKAALRRLGELGETKDVTPIAEAIVKLAKGEQLTSKEINILNESEAGHIVASEINKDNIQSGGLGNTWAENIGTRRISPDAYNKNAYNKEIFEAAVRKATQEATEKASVDKKLGASAGEAEKNIKVSDSGKTIYKHGNDAEDVTIKKVVSTKGGLKVELDNGKQVSVKDLEFSTAEEGIMYEMVARMEVSPETANLILQTFKPANGQQATYLFNAVPLTYQYGKMGYEAGLKNINLSNGQKKLIYNQGRKDADIESKAKPGKATASNTEKGKLNESNTDKGESTKKGIIFEDGLVHDEATANEMQKKGVIGAEVITKMTNLEVHMFASEVDENGNRVAHINGKTVKVAPNGFFKGGNKIYIDYNAGDSGEGAILYTLSHEATHYIREWNAEGFKELADYLIEQYGKNGVSVDALLEVEKESLKEMYEEEGKALPSEAELNDMAYEELVADAMSDMFADPKAYEKLADFKKKHYKVWKKLGEIIRGLLDKLKGALGIYKKDAPVSEAADEVRNFSADVYEKLQDLYIKAFVKADANYEAASKNGTAEKYLRNRDITYNLRAKKSHQEKLADQYSKDASVDLDTLMQRYNKIISIWESLGGELNSKFLTEWNNKVGKDRAFTVFKAQAGYKYNVELSSMCKKGVPLFEAIDTIVKQEVMKELNTDVLGKEEKEILYDLLKSHDFEIPCAICYVEQARQREGVIIDSFLNGKVEKNNAGKVTTFKLGWNEVLKSVEKEMKELGVDYTFPSVDRNIATDNYTPADITMDEATQNAFYNALKKVANKEIARYNKAEGKNRKFVTTVTPSAIKEVFKGTLPSNLKIFKVLFTEPSSRLTLESDLLYSSLTTHNLATAHNALYSLFNSQGGVSGYKTKQGTVVYWGDILGKTWTPAKVRDEGGIRNQSNSDFQMYTLLDQAQMYIDFTAKGYYLQAYTKVLSELKLFGLSRGKINASLIPAVYVYHNADGSVDFETTRAYAGLDKDGNLLFDDIEGINHKEAFMLLEDAEYSKSIGGICIGYSDEHILKLLDDSRIQQIIGFHDKTDDPNKRYRGARYAKNYNGLNEAINNKDGKTVHIGFNPFIRKAEKKFTFNSKTETYEGEIEYNGKTYVADDIPKLAADMYLKMCEEKDYTPAYTDFDFHENYYKLLADFSLYDSEGHYAPHRKVAYNMPDKVPYLDLNGKKQYMSSKDYIKAELEKELKVRDSISEALADKSEEGLIPQFVKKVNESKQDQSEPKFSSRNKRTSDTQAKITARYKRIVDQVIAGTYNSKDNALMGYTPEIFRTLGMPSLPFVIGAGHIYSTAVTEAEAKADPLKRFRKDTHYHGLGTDAVKKLYTAIQDPVMIISAKDTDKKNTAPRSLHSVVAIIDVGNSSEHLLMPVEITAVRQVNGNRIDVNTLSSAYMRDVSGLVQEAIAQTNIGDVGIYYMKKEATNLLSGRVSFSKQLTGLAASTDGIIHQFSEKINMQIDDVTKSLQFVDWFGDWQNEPEKASKVVNDDGTPMVVYHGSKSGNIKTFRTTNENGTGGLYLSTNRSVAENFAGGEGEVYENYVNLRKPLIVDAEGAYYDNIAVPSEMVGSQYTFGSSTVDTNAIAAYARDAGYDGVIVRNVRESAGFGDDIIAFNSNQVKSVDNVGTFDKRKDNSMYSLRGKGNVSTRTLLANALESTAQNDIEKNKLKQYKDKIALIESEQAKLNETREKANALRFTKGRTPNETKMMRDLDTEATQIANRISTWDKQLLNLESTTALKNVLNREKALLRKKLEQKSKESLKAQREKDAKTVRELMARHQESRHKAVESRNKTEMRHSIRKLLKRLNKLFNGGKERNVKEGMKETVATALALGDILFNNEFSNKDIVNLGVESVTEKESKLLNEYRDLLMKKESNEDRIKSLHESGDKASAYAYIFELEAQNRKHDRRITELNKALSDVFIRERARLNRTPVSALIDKLASEYQSLKESEDKYIKNAYEPELYNKLIDLKTKLGGVVAKDMSISQLEAVHKVFTMIEHSVRTANQYFRNGKFEDLQTSASAIMEEIEKLKDTKQISPELAAKAKSFLWNELAPYYAFDKIGSETLMTYFLDLLKGQNVFARDVKEAKLFAAETRAKYGYSKWELDKMYDFKLRDGRTFSTTLRHLLSVYAYSKRDQAEAHMSVGGFFHNDKTTFRKEKGVLKMRRTDAVGYKVDAEVLAEIKTALGKEKTDYVDDMLGYLTKMGEKGNEVTRIMWGVDIFTEKVYFPLKSKEDFLKQSTETAQAVSLKNDGMTKETIPGASNPIVLEAFDDVWANHIERMSQYHGLVVPIDNLNKVLHYGTWAGTDSMSVSTMLEGKFTSAATDYLEQFINDLNGGAISKGVTNPFWGFFSKWKKTAVGASMSTVVQQPTAILRALSEIDAKYFVGKPNLAKLSEQVEEMQTYAPVAIIKEIGGFDAGGGKQAARWINSDTLTGIDKVGDTIDNISMKGAEIADKIGWAIIWEAVKRETQATTSFEVGSQEFLEKCGDRFTEVINKTQVYDSTLSRSGYMRSKNEGVKMLTSFMGEPTVSINMMYSAVINAMRGGKEAKLKAARTIGCVYASIILAEALASAIYALRDDDEDESYWEKYLQSLGGSFISDIVLAPVTSLPGVKDFISIFQGWDIERSDMAIFKDIKDAFDGLFSESKSTYRKIEDFAGAIAALFGVPLKNVLRTGREIYNAIDDIFDGIEPHNGGAAFGDGVRGDNRSKTDKVYYAVLSGDKERIAVCREWYDDNSYFKSAIRKGLRENDPRIKKAAEAVIAGDTSKRAKIAKEIQAEGHLNLADIQAAINAEVDALRKKKKKSKQSRGGI